MTARATKMNASGALDYFGSFLLIGDAAELAKKIHKLFLCNMSSGHLSHRTKMAQTRCCRTGHREAPLQTNTGLRQLARTAVFGEIQSSRFWFDRPALKIPFLIIRGYAKIYQHLLKNYNHQKCLTHWTDL